MASYVLDKAYRVAASGGVGPNLAVVQGASDGECDLPSGANEASLLGATVHSAEKDQNVAVRKLGIASLTVAGAVNAGEKVCIADSQGRIKAAGRAFAKTGDEAHNNAITWFAVNPGSGGNNLTIDIEVCTGNTSLEVEVHGNTVKVYPATDLDEVITTAKRIVAMVNDDPVASRLIFGVVDEACDGNGVVDDRSVDFRGGEEGDNAFGIAEETATAQGDIIDVFLTI